MGHGWLFFSLLPSSRTIEYHRPRILDFEDLNYNDNNNNKKTAHHLSFHPECYIASEELLAASSNVRVIAIVS
jgi:hypothetical protein